MTTLWQDIRYGCRMLGRSTGLAVTAVLCLGLGIGATTTIFSVVNGALLRPFPYEKPDELALIGEQSSQDPLSAEGHRRRQKASAPTSFWSISAYHHSASRPVGAEGNCP